jgi:hypothetical protein
LKLNIEELLGFSFLLLSVFFLLVISAFQRKHPRGVFRSIPTLERLRKEVFLSVEGGKRLHISIGNANLLSENCASALVGLSVLERLAQVSMASDRPPIVTSGDGAFSLLSRDMLHYTCQAGNALQLFDPDRGQLAGVTPFSYVCGVLPLLHKEKISTNLLIGNFGPEVAYLCETAEQEEEFTLAASDSLTAQAVMYAAAEDPLIGEELFALPAYIQSTPFSTASLQVQDILRWVLVFTLIGGALFKFSTSILGIEF